MNYALAKQWHLWVLQGPLNHGKKSYCMPDKEFPRAQANLLLRQITSSPTLLFLPPRFAAIFVSSGPWQSCLGEVLSEHNLERKNTLNTCTPLFYISVHLLCGGGRHLSKDVFFFFFPALCCRHPRIKVFFLRHANWCRILQLVPVLNKGLGPFTTFSWSCSTPRTVRRAQLTMHVGSPC